MVDYVMQASGAFQSAFQAVVAETVVSAIVTLVIAIILVLVGWIIGKILKQIIIKVLQSTKIDQWVEEQNLSAAIGHKEISVLCGSIVKWWVIAVFLAQAAATLSMATLSAFVAGIAIIIPQVLVAIVIVVVGLLLGRYAKNAIEATEHRFKKTVGLIVELIIIYLAAVIALGLFEEYGFNIEVLKNAFYIAFTAFAITLAIIVGIAFGLAFKDDAKKIVADLKKSTKFK